jgi:hypothetical protein
MSYKVDSEAPKFRLMYIQIYIKDIWLRGLESMRTALIEERLEEIRNAELTKKKILNLE